MHALILVDLQNDFLPGGALAVPDGNQVIPVASTLATQFDHVVITQDWHPVDHVSFASRHLGGNVGDVVETDNGSQVLWPTHCVAGTRGSSCSDSLVLPPDTLIIRKGTHPDRDSYSGFFDNQREHSTGLAEELAQRKVQRVYVMGLATDYCVKFTVLDAIELGLETYVVLDGCRGVDLNAGDVDEALETMRGAGAHLVSSDEIDLGVFSPRS